MQGYYFSKPVAADAIEAMLREHHRLPQKLLARSKRDRTLLLVDDEENILACLEQSLGGDGYRILRARSAAEGLQRLADAPVDVIVSDQRMPGMTGVEFLRRVADIYPGTVRMLLSSSAEPESIIAAITDGTVCKLLTKPWDTERLRAVVAEAFQLREMGEENRRLAREVESAHASLAGLNDRLQRVLAQQSDHAQILERSADSAREILDSIPASIIGVDPDGLIAFVNAGSDGILPQLACAIGDHAETALPAPLRHLLRGTDAEECRIEIGANRFHALARTVQSTGATQGRLIILFPAETTVRGSCACRT
jgi:CheY-like chemotaxis protein